MLPTPNKFNLKEKRKNVNQGRGDPGDALGEAAVWGTSCDPRAARGGRKGQHWGHFGLGVSIV